MRREARAHTLSALLVGISTLCMAAALVGFPTLGLLTAGTFALLVLGAPLARRNLRSLVPHFTSGLVTSVGQPARWSLRIDNHRRPARDVRISLDEGRRKLAPLAAGWAGEIHGASQSVDLHPRFAHRGHYSSVELELHSAWPLAWIEERCRWRVPTDLWVLPRIVRLSPSALRSLESGVEHSDLHGHEGDIDSLREWRAGESLRPVAWKLSAHRGKRLVVERREQSALALRVHLLTVMGSVRPAHSHPFESAVILAASLLAHHAQLGARVTLVIESGDGPSAPAPTVRGSNELLGLMRQLAQVEAKSGSLSQAIAAIASPREGEVVWVIAATRVESPPQGVRLADAPEQTLNELRLETASLGFHP